VVKAAPAEPKAPAAPKAEETPAAEPHSETLATL
jgi:hypothetical protein